LVNQTGMVMKMETGLGVPTVNKSSRIGKTAPEHTGWIVDGEQPPYLV
jgi:hypothetical protein